jgi:hypothetical protein
MRAQANMEIRESFTRFLNENLTKIDKVFKRVTTKKKYGLGDGIQERASGFGVVGFRRYDFLAFD